MTTYDILIDTYIGYHPATKSAVRSVLDHNQGQPVNVRINSYGGDVQTALDIRQQFIDHGNITTCIFGMTASAATILAMGAQHIKMSRYALMLIHRCSGWVDTWGQMNADELAEAIKQLQSRHADLETIDRVVAELYAVRTGRTAKEMAEVMAKAAWLTAEECLQLGLIDEIIEEGEPAHITAALGEDFQACGLPIPDPDTHNPTTTNTHNNMDQQHNPAEVEAITAERDNLHAQVEQFTAEVEQLNAQVATLTAERDDFHAQVEQLTAQVEALSQADGDDTDNIEADEADEAPADNVAARMYENLKGIL